MTGPLRRTVFRHLWRDFCRGGEVRERAPLSGDEAVQRFFRAGGLIAASQGASRLVPLPQ